jgi:predicted HicB family RNase H-like nuclease
MKAGRFNMRMDARLLEQVSAIAQKRGVTMTLLVEQFFRQLVHEETKPKTDEELGVEQG